MSHKEDVDSFNAYLYNSDVNMDSTTKNEETCTKALIEMGASVNKADLSGRTPLMAAAEAGCSEDIKHLIHAPADLNLKNSVGMTALMFASLRDDTECLELLLAAGADADVKDNEGFTPLMLSSCKGKLESVKTLLLHGVNKNAVNKSRMSALMLAASEGQHDCLRTLMLAGCDAKIKDTYGNTSLMLATIHNKIGCVTNLSSHWVDIDAKNNEGMTALMFATPDSHQVVLQHLLMAGASTDLNNAKGKTALMIASESDEFYAVKSLIDSNADIDLSNNNGNTALILAAGKDSVFSLKCLIEKGANLEHDNVRGETALMVAAKHGSSRCLDALLRNHADINHQSKETGMTALMLAAENGYVSPLKLLIQGGAKLELQNQESKTALMISIEKGMYNSFSSLLQAGASVLATNQDGQTPLMLAAAIQHTLYILGLLQAVNASGHFTGVYINKKDKHANTALMVAAEKGFNANVEILIQHGAEVNMVNDKGESPLVLASLAGHGGCVRILVQNCALCMNDESGQKAMMKAIVLGQTDIVEALIEAGGKVNLPDKLGRTPLMWATGLRQTSIAELLLQQGAYVDHTDRDGNTALMITVASDHLLDTKSVLELLDKDRSDLTDSANESIDDKSQQYLRLMVEACADINKVNNEGRNAVMLAVMSKRAVSATHVCLLLANGGNCNLQDDNGYTALMHAVASSSDDECVLALLKANVNVDVQDRKGQSALMLAKSHKHLIYLLTAHADVNLTDNDGKTALMFAVGNQELLCLPSDIIKSLFSSLTGCNAGLDTQDSQGETALMKASSAGNKFHKIIEALLQNGANVDLKDHNGRTALMHSTLSGPLDKEKTEDSIFPEIAKLLVDHGSNVDDQDNKGMTTLMMASLKGMEKMVQTLLDCGANVNVQDHTGKTVLMHIVIENMLCEKVAQKLVKRGLDVNLQDENGMTALMIASSKGKMETVCTLLDYEASVNLQDKTGKTALMHAIYFQNKKSDEDSGGKDVDVKESIGKDSNVETGDVKTVDVEDSDVKTGDVEDSDVKTGGVEDSDVQTGGVKDSDVKTGDVEDSDVETSDDEDSDVEDSEKLSQEDMECLAVVEELTFYGGAYVNIQDKDGRTALMHAASCNYPLSRELMFALERNNLRFDMCDNEGNSALVYAVKNSFTWKTNRTVLHLLNDEVFTKFRAMKTSYLDSSFMSCFIESILWKHLRFDDDGYEEVAIARFMVSNGVMPIFMNHHGKDDDKKWSPLLQVLQKVYYSYADLHIAKYLIANCYLTKTDLDRIRSSKFPHRMNDYVKSFLKEAVAQPWPLVKLAQIAVSTAIGPSPGREERIRGTGLPLPIMECLMFDRPIALLHRNWEDIPMCFDPQQYALQPFTHPLLYNWPFGHHLVLCKCHICYDKNENFRFTEFFKP